MTRVSASAFSWSWANDPTKSSSSPRVGYWNYFHISVCCETPNQKKPPKKRKGSHRSEHINLSGIQTLINPASLTNAYERLLNLARPRKCLVNPQELVKVRWGRMEEGVGLIHKHRWTHVDNSLALGVTNRFYCLRQQSEVTLRRSLHRNTLCSDSCCWVECLRLSRGDQIAVEPRLEYRFQWAQACRA